MSKNKTKFQPVTLVLNKKELRMLHAFVNHTDWSHSETLVGNGDTSYDLYDKLNKEMLNQNIKPVSKHIHFTITE